MACVLICQVCFRHLRHTEKGPRSHITSLTLSSCHDITPLLSVETKGEPPTQHGPTIRDVNGFAAAWNITR